MPTVNGRRIKQLRKELGWSVMDLTERTRSLTVPGITRSALGRVEREETKNVAIGIFFQGSFLLKILDSRVLFD